MDSTVNRGARGECHVGQTACAGAQPAGLPARRDGAPLAMRLPRAQEPFSRPRRESGSAEPAAVGTTATLLAAGAWTAAVGFLLDSALTSCLLTVWTIPGGAIHGACGLSSGARLYRCPTGAQALHIPHRNAWDLPAPAGEPASSRCQQKMGRKPRRSRAISDKDSQSRQTRHCSRPCWKMSWGRSMPMKTILLWRFSPSAHCGPRSLPMSWCTPWKITLRSVPCMFSTPL